MVKPWSKMESGTSVESIDPSTNTLKLDNGKTFTYKSLLLAPGFDTGEHQIKGLEDML
jgi:NADH dehydrogenase FAD-containing subunit